MSSGNLHIEHSCDATYANIEDKVYRSIEFFYDNIDLFLNRTPKSIIREWLSVMNLRLTD